MSSFVSSLLRRLSPEVVAKRQRRGPILPKRIILIRHGESLGNVDETAYAEIPDWKIPLTELGLKQAEQAGKQLKTLCAGESMYVYVSPYHRTMQTWQIIKQELDANEPAGQGSSTESSNTDSEIRILGTRQEPRIAEQQFGNFQNPRKVLAAKEERRNFGRFFFRFPNGEAGLDVYNRATAFLSTMSRDVGQYRDSDESMENFNVLVVTHGLTLRLILMRYFQLTVEEFEESHNAENGKLYIMNRTNSEEFAPGREFFRLEEDSRDALNLKGDVSNEKPVFERDGRDF